MKLWSIQSAARNEGEGVGRISLEGDITGRKKALIPPRKSRVGSLDIAQLVGVEIGAFVAQSQLHRETIYFVFVAAVECVDVFFVQEAIGFAVILQPNGTISFLVICGIIGIDKGIFVPGFQFSVVANL